MANEIYEADYYDMGLNSYDGEEPYIFVSYSHVDVLKVREILKRIDREKFRYWYDDTMEIGEDFRLELQTKIENCSAFLLFISDASMQSKYCGMEIIMAFKNNKRIFPVYLDDATVIPGALKMILENLQHVKGASIDKDAKYIDKLIASLPTETMRSLSIENDVLLRCKDGSSTISVPEGVRVIGAGAFKNCEKLEVLNIGDTVESMLTEACRGCKHLDSLVLPKNVRYVGESAFRDCTHLTSLSVENDDIELGERAFENCATLEDIHLANGISEIYGGVFNSCKALRSITLPENLTVLGESSFADCVSLKEIDIPENVTKIDDMVFNGCLSLEHIDMKDKITKIGKYAFKDCKSLEKIFLPKSVNSIGIGSFRGCTNLKEITVDAKNRYFKSVDNVLFNKSKSVLLAFSPKQPISSYTIPDSVIEIRAWSFCNCTSLEQIIIPDSVSEIGEGAFYQCESLRNIVIPDSVDKIDDTAFRGCVNLESVIIPDSVTDFGWGVFNGCDKLRVICSDKSTAAQYCDKKGIPHSAE
ncbi:MAG: leucine-rich repeat protein [Clostridia bacterium]|nr:leucine-rich repeat protein [Clostridia bacterium]